MLDVPSVQLECGGDFIDGPTLEAIQAGIKVKELFGLLDGMADHLYWAIDDEATWGYIRKWLGDTKNGPQNVAQALVGLLETKNPQYAFEFTASDRIDLNRLLAEHSRQYAVPKPDHLSQFGKTVTLQSVRSWLDQLRGQDGA